MPNTTPTAANRRQRCYIAAALCLLTLTAILRFYQLPEHILWYDEAVAANHAQQSISHLLHETRHHNTSPILNPLILYATQKIHSSPFTVRAASAIVSALTVAALLFLLPRAGISRAITLLTAPLIILSAPAIQHSQNAREYSLDAFVALMLIIGLLSYLRHRQKALLCASLLIAPLTQYGLILFAIAILCAAAIHTPKQKHNPHQSRIHNWINPRLPLIPPAAFFLTGCAITYAITLRFQLQARDRVLIYLKNGYYQGDWNNLTSIIEFAYSRTQKFLDYHLPQDTETLAIAAIAIALIISLTQRRPHPILTLFLISLTIAIAAALLKIYPLADFRQTIYLSPALFLSIAVALHTLINLLNSRTRPSWIAPTAATILFALIAINGIRTLQQNNPYQDLTQAKTVLTALQQQPQENEIIYVSEKLTPTIKFYQNQLPDSNYHHCRQSPNFGACQQDLIKQTNFSPTGQTWILAYPHELQTLKPFDHRFQVTPAASQDITLLQIKGRAIPQEQWQTKLNAAPDPIIRADFNVHLANNELLYTKNPCHPSDTTPKFSLHLYPANPNDIPPDRQPHGFDNQDFTFRHTTAAIINRQCLAAIQLPPYPLTAIRTGQYINHGNGNYQILWQARHQFPQ